MPKRNGNNAYEKNLESSSADSLLNQSFDLTEDEAEDFMAELNGEKPGVHTKVGTFDVVDGAGADSVTIWWNSVQKALNDAKADIDLSRKEDLMRFRIVDITRTDTSKKIVMDMESVASSHLAFVDDKNFDYAHASQADILSAINGKITREKIEELYNAAKEARLFVNSLTEREQGQRQLVVNENGEAEVNSDSMHPAKEFLTAVANRTAPIKPSKPLALWTRILALFGNENAKEKLANIDKDYKRDMQEYEAFSRDWAATEKMDKDFVRQSRNMNIAVSNHFNVPCDEEGYQREIHIRNIGNAAHKQYRVDALKDTADKALAADCRALGEALKKSPDMTPEKERILADIFYQASSKTSIAARMKNDDLTESRIDLYEKQLEKGTPEYEKQLNLICESKLFKNTVKDFSADELKMLAEQPEKTLGAVYDKFVRNMKEAPETHPKLDPVKVKQPVKDDSAVIHSKSAASHI